MGRPTDKSRVDKWKARLKAANKVYTDWEKEYDCDLLEDFYRGFQWKGEDIEGAERDKYVVNLVNASIRTREPSLLFFNPVARVSPREAKADDPGTFVDERAKLREDIANTYMGDPRLYFQEQAALSLHETFFRFGVMKTCYTGNYEENPNAQKPVLKGDTGQELKDANGEPVMGPDRVPSEEAVSFERISARNFRVSASNRNILEFNDWCGYYSWEQVEDVKRNPAYKNTSALKEGGKLKGDLDERTEEEKDNAEQGLIKVWRIWDIRTKTKYVFAENAERFFVDGEHYDVLPFWTLKFDENLDSFYPIPLVWQWIHPQREYNDIKEKRRAHRKRFHRKFGFRPEVDKEEVEKLMVGGDGTAVELPGQDSFWAIPDAPLDASTERDAMASKDDFREVSSVSAEQNAIPESQTATQANIIENKSNIRENFQRFLVAKWLGNGVRILLKTVEKHMVLPMLIKTTVDPTAMGASQELQRVFETWRSIQVADLSDFEYDCTVDIESLSPATQDARRQQWFSTWDLITRNPALMMGIAASDVIAKKTFNLLEVRSQREIAEIRMIVTLIAISQGMMQGGQPGAGGAPGGAPDAASPTPEPGPGQTPTMPEIQNQLGAQMGTAA